MIFRQIEDIVAGRKTQTRRVIDPDKTRLVDSAGNYWRIDEPRERFRIEAIQILGKDGKWRVKWQVGKVYAMIPKMGKSGVGFYRITRLGAERVQDIQPSDARAEGIMVVYTASNRALFFSRNLEDVTQATSVDAYQVLWESINGKYKGARWSDNPYVAVIEIEYAGIPK